MIEWWISRPVGTSYQMSQMSRLLCPPVCQLSPVLQGLQVPFSAPRPFLLACEGWKVGRANLGIVHKWILKRSHVTNEKIDPKTLMLYYSMHRLRYTFVLNVLPIPTPSSPIEKVNNKIGKIIPEPSKYIIKLPDLCITAS